VATVRIASGTGLVSAAILLGDCSSSEEPHDPLVLDWKRGTYEGLRLGHDSAKLRRILGPPLRHGPEEPFEPIGEDFYEIGGLTNFADPKIGTAPGGSSTLRYRRRVFLTTAHRLTAWGTTDHRAQTPEGVGIGDRQELVTRRYPAADCFIQNEGTEYPEYPLCRVRVCAGRLLGFGGDPIKSLWLAAETKTGLKRCVTPR
jgi:hypothetical protein